MHTVNLKDVPEQERKSPKGKFGSVSKNISIAPFFPSQPEGEFPPAKLRRTALEAVPHEESKFKRYP